MLVLRTDKCQVVLPTCIQVDTRHHGKFWLLTENREDTESIRSGTSPVHQDIQFQGFHPTAAGHLTSKRKNHYYS